MTISKKDIRFLAYACYASFGVYFCMYAFRKPFTVATFEDMELFGVSYKILLIIIQVLGYMTSKFLGIKFISELRAKNRLPYLIALIAFAELTLILFGWISPPYNSFLMFFNGLSLGLVWGIVFSYLEGRKFTEILGVALCSSFIVSSGIVKTSGFLVMRDMGVSEFWMPAVTGAFYFALFVSFAYLLNKIPPPNEDDIRLRKERRPMGAEQRKKVFLSYAFALTILVIFYIGLTALRDFRDNFAREIWDAVGYAGNPAIYSISEIPIAIVVLVGIGFFVLVKDSYKALKYYHYLFIAGSLFIGLNTLLFENKLVGPAFWMINAGLGLYLCYVPFNCIFFDRIIAAFRIEGNSGFLIYIADSFGYLGSMAVLLYKNFGGGGITWLRFFMNATYLITVVGVLISIASLIYFKRKHKEQFAQLERQIPVSDL